MKNLLIAAALVLLAAGAAQAQSSIVFVVNSNAKYFQVSGCTSGDFQAQARPQSLPNSLGVQGTVQGFAPDPYLSVTVPNTGSVVFPLTRGVMPITGNPVPASGIGIFKFTNNGTGTCSGRIMGDSTLTNWPQFTIQ